MGAPRGRALRPVGIVRGLGRLLLLVALGFGAGLLIGIVFEEPELIASHLRGESESVEIAEVEALAREEAAPAYQLDATDVGMAVKAREASAAAESDRPRSTREDDGLPAVAANNPEPSTGPPAAEPPARASVVSRKVRAPASARAWAVQVGAFSDRATASGVADSLLAKGYPVELVPAKGKTYRWRVRVQPVLGEVAAREMAERLKRDERLPTWVLPMEARSGS